MVGGVILGNVILVVRIAWVRGRSNIYLDGGNSTFYFHPENWGNDPIWLILVQMGWFNHQRDKWFFGNPHLLAAMKRYEYRPRKEGEWDPTVSRTYDHHGYSSNIHKYPGMIVFDVNLFIFDCEDSGILVMFSVSIYPLPPRKASCKSRSSYWNLRLPENVAVVVILGNLGALPNLKKVVTHLGFFTPGWWQAQAMGTWDTWSVLELFFLQLIDMHR